MVIEKNKVVSTTNQKPIVCDIYHNGSGLPKPVVLLCHGYKGFKDWGAWHLVAQSFANANFFFLKFNFSHNGGTVEQPIDFPDLEAFAQNNFSKELDDLNRVLDFLISEENYHSDIDSEKISLIGHSRGGGIVLIKAEENIRIKNVITWAGVSDFKIRFQEGSDHFKQWKETGRTYIENGRTKQQMPHDWQFYENFLANEERLTIGRAVKNLKKPQLIVHGSDDPTVSLKEAQLLHHWNPNSQLAIIDNANHVFGAEHPWESTSLPTHLKEVIKVSITFLKG